MAIHNLQSHALVGAPVLPPDPQLKNYRYLFATPRIWGLLEAKVNAKIHRSLDALKANIKKEWSKLPMTIVSMYAYINPIVAVMLGWLFLDEKLNFKIAVAILITIAGIYIVNRGYQLRDLWRTQVSSE